MRTAAVVAVVLVVLASTNVAMLVQLRASMARESRAKSDADAAYAGWDRTREMLDDTTGVLERTTAKLVETTAHLDRMCDLVESNGKRKAR